MAHDVMYLNLETPLRMNGNFTGVCDLMIFDIHQNQHLMRTRVSKQAFEFQGILRQGYSTFLVLEGSVQFHQEKWVVRKGAGTKVFPRQEMCTSMIPMVIESCAGLGAMGRGLEYSGFRILAMNDKNVAMCELAGKHRPNTPIILGDIGAGSTIEALAGLSEWPVSMAAGIACQPYSNLGDRKSGYDERAQSLPGTLKASYCLGSPIIFLECVERAHTDTWVQSILSQFMQQTGYSCSQTVMHLDHIWVARRTRWWCVLVNPDLGKADLHPMPRLASSPTVGDVLPDFLVCSKEVLQDLECDLYEVRTFKDFGGLEQSVLRLQDTCRTCLHSCGTQLSQCPCGCRKAGFTEQRLAEKGLHGILVQLEGSLQHVNGEVYPRLRHIHPWELSLINGLPPDWCWDENLKLSLAGIGQLASPIQSVWIGSHVMMLLGRRELLREWVPNPSEALGNLVRKLFHCRDQVFRHVEKSARLVNFEKEMFSLLKLVPVFDNFLRVPPPTGQQQEQTDNSTSNEHKGQAHEAASLTKPQLHPQAGEKGGKEDHSTPQQASITQTSAHANGGKEAEFQTKGAIPGFGNVEKSGTQTKPGKEHEEAPPPSPAPTIHYKSQSEDGESGGHDRATEIWVQGIGHTGLTRVTVQEPSTVGMVITAESKLAGSQAIVTPITLVGEAWPLATIVTQGQVILTRDGSVWNPSKCPVSGGRSPHIQSGATRLEAICKQEGWIAMDEMKFYVGKLEIFSDYGTIEPFHFQPEQEWQHQINRWLGTDPFVQRQVDAVGQGVVSVVLVNHHWIPVAITLTVEGLLVHIPPEAPELVEAIIRWAGSTRCNVVHIPVPQMFHADCGWQSLAWMIAVTQQSPVEAIKAERAVKLRESFVEELLRGGKSDECCGRLELGGMISSTEIVGKVSLLLQEHGVPDEVRRIRAEQTVQAIGQGPVAKAFQSQRPWQELKSLANQCQPKFQLVLPSELQQQLALRAKSQQPVSRHRAKGKELDFERRATPHIHASDISIPHGVFRQADGQLLSQLELSEVSKECKGVLVQDPAEGSLMLQAARPVTKGGLGLLIVPPDPSNATDNQIRFPAHFKTTEEPILLVGELHQLGEQNIMRNLPEHQLELEKTATEVIRCLVFRDEMQTDWEAFRQQPVKKVLEGLKMDGRRTQTQASSVLDVWDRQWVSHRFERMKAEQASVFIVSLRINAQQLGDTLQHSGEGGIYVEPRASHGRGQNPDYAVTWLAKQTTLAAAKLAKQTSQHPATLARVGTRYGLRSDIYHQQAMHQQHKPDAMYLPGGRDSSICLDRSHLAPPPIAWRRSSRHGNGKPDLSSRKEGPPMGQGPNG